MKRDSTVVHGRTFLVTDRSGRPAGDHDGFYHEDTRHLDRYDLAFSSRDLESIEITAPRPGQRVLHVATPIETGARSLSLTREQAVTDGLYERFTVENLGEEPVDETLSLSVGTRFDDLFEIRGHHERLSREVTAETDGALAFRYDTPDIDFSRTTTVLAPGFDAGVSTAGERADATLVRELSLEPGGTDTVSIAALPRDDVVDPTRAFDEACDRLARREERWRERTALSATGEPAVDAVLSRSREDLLSLTIDTEFGPVFAAGTPWFATAFGRDSLIAAYQTLALSTEPAAATLRYLAAHQADREDAFREATPGKIMHEIRGGELVARGIVPHAPYYGTIDATALFCVLLHETWRRTGDDALLSDLEGTLDRAVDWLDAYGDRDGDGFLEYPLDGEALTHRAWKDSGDGIVHPDGSHPEGPLAVAEVQGYAYDAKRRAADCYRALGRDDRACELEREARSLARYFDERFWLADEEFYAVALDGSGDPVRTVTTNPGHCLWSGLVPEERADGVIDRLVSEDMFSGWGIRTLSSDHAAYNPQSYHRGSVWPHDNSLIVLGMLRYGRPEAAERVARGLFRAARERGTDRLPELFSGIAAAEAAVPIEYGVACEPQAWAAGTPIACREALSKLPASETDLVRQR
ncbi:MAG: glycogen debranching N-terminal domain-containing protein [Halalkalicoccus sp.]